MDHGLKHQRENSYSQPSAFNHDNLNLAHASSVFLRVPSHLALVFCHQATHLQKKCQHAPQKLVRRNIKLWLLVTRDPRKGKLYGRVGTPWLWMSDQRESAGI